MDKATLRTLSAADQDLLRTTESAPAKRASK